VKDVRNFLRFVKFLVIISFINMDRYEVSIAQLQHELLFKYELLSIIIKPISMPFEIAVDIINIFHLGFMCKYIQANGYNMYMLHVLGTIISLTHSRIIPCSVT